MNCCANCFHDSVIKSIIESQKNHGDCDFCGTSDTNIYNIEDAEHTLSDLLYGLISIYSTEYSLDSSFSKSKFKPLSHVLYDDWSIFNIEPDKIYLLVKAICSDKYSEYPELFDSPVFLKQLSDEEYLNSNSLLKSHTWDRFVDEIKTTNRFHLNYINIDILEHFIDAANILYHAGDKFYRARISTDKNGFSSDEMGAPPLKFAKAGRVNAEGISVLYLADSINTAVYEVRAGRYDYLTIGTFELKEDIKVVSLDSLKNASPFLRDGDGYIQHAVNLAHLKRLSQEVARPLRRHDSSLDYLPTQYFSDFIKSQEGISGLTYKSAMFVGGVNLAAFVPPTATSPFHCVDTQVLEIKDLKYYW